MSLKYKYAIFIIIIHAVLVILLYHLLKENKWFFMASEAFIGVSLLLSYSLYRQLIRPLQLMQSGSDALIDSDFSIKYVNTGSREMDKLIQVYNTMIDRLREERTSMEEQSYFLNKLIEVSPIGMIIMDYDNQLSDANAKAVMYLKLPKNWKGKKLNDFQHPLAQQLNKIQVNGQKLIDINGINKFKCQVNHVIHKGFARKFIMIEELTSELLESEKRAYGKVIRMMAHEVNNSMGAVNSILSTIQEYGFSHSDADPELKSSLAVAINRNDSLATFMNNFAEVIRLPSPNRGPCPLNSLIKRIGQLYEQQANDRNISIHYQLSTKESMIKIDSVQMEQVLSNIITNAIESIHQNGNIHLITTNDPVGFMVRDDGPGILDEDANKLFSPFYSTKPTGQGIGLILCRDILQNHGAAFELKTNKLTGLTEFRVEF
jgi:nitrogen fixation/metabolism regulation signal transduction histidine kinase